MSREQFVEKRFKDATLKTIVKANEILAEYEQQNLVLTLRQLYYQFVTRGLLPNKQTEYKRLGDILSNARLAGMIDWDLMEDRTRFVRKPSVWNSPSDIIDAVASQYREDLWADQKYRPEVWIEKDALVGVIENICEEMRVPHFACRGYSSQSAQYEAGMRFRRQLRKGQKPIILHFGDHDPSGIDMTRDNQARISMFAGRQIEVRRLALNMDQVEEFNPPPNPAKESDSRAEDYIAEYGNESWELDALEPSVISRLIRDEVLKLRDDAVWQTSLDAESENKEDLQYVSNQWDDVREFVRGNRADDE